MQSLHHSGFNQCGGHCIYRKGIILATSFILWNSHRQVMTHTDRCVPVISRDQSMQHSIQEALWNGMHIDIMLIRMNWSSRQDAGTGRWARCCAVHVNAQYLCAIGIPRLNASSWGSTVASYEGVSSSKRHV